MAAGDETGGRASGLEALAVSSADIPLPGAPPASPPLPGPAIRAPASAPKSALDQAVALHRAGKHAEAAAAYDAILLAAPTDARVWVNQGVVLRALGRLEAAAACYRRALALEPGNAGIHSNLGNVLRQLERFAEAIDCQKRTLSLDPANHAAEYNLALALRDLGHRDEALGYFNRCIAGGHARPEVLVEHAATLLAAGDYARGFERFEARLKLPDAAPAGSDAPVWDGAPLDGKSILVQAEPGTRDTLTFLRYVPALAARGARVTVSAPAGLATLVGAVPGVGMVVPAGRKAPATDLRIPLNSLPRLFGAQLDTVPQEVPYLALPRGRAARQWVNPAPGGGRKVGIVWSDRGVRDRIARACPLACFLRLAGIPGITLYRLQTGAAAAERDEQGARALVRDIDGAFADLADAAEAILELDLVIGVDSAALVLAGALGRPGMVLLPMGADWRWGADGERSPWFPTLRLFRQAAPGDWDGVFARVGAALGERAPPPASPMLKASPPATQPAARPPQAAAAAPAQPPPKPAAAAAPPKPKPPPGPAIAAPAGPRQAVRSFLHEHVAPGDIVVEVGSGDEGLALGAAMRHPGQVRVLAFGLQGEWQTELRARAERAGIAAAVETLRAGLGARTSPAHATVAPRTTLDAVLRDRAELTGRIFLCLSAGERAAEIVAGAMDLLAKGRIAALLWRADASDQMDAARQTGLLGDLARLGFGHFRLPDDDLGGKLLPYVALPEPATVFSLARGFERRAGYVGAPRGGMPLLEGRRFATLDPAQRRARTAVLVRARGTDAARWADPASLEDGAEHRASFAGPHLVPAGAGDPRVLDLGAGLMRLARHLPPAARYVPTDLALRSADTLLVDLNQGDFPAGSFEAVAMLDVLEFMHDAPGLLQRARTASPRLVLTYRLSDGTDHDARAEAGWFNAFTRSVLESHLAIAGWVVGAHHRSGPYDLFVCDAAGPAA
ncbi:MAG: glycosyltransferase family protein [Alphaproteobacteria bacterium]|nr:glycosyltransferase family protein [Alphaproteobacteria bacterium]